MEAVYARFDLGEMVLPVVEPLVDLVRRGQLAPLEGGVVEKRGQRVAEFAEVPALVVNDRVKPLAARRVDVGILFDDLGGRAQRGDPGQYLVDGFGEERVVGQAVAEHPGDVVCPPLGTRQRDDAARPARETADHFADAVDLGTERAQLRILRDLVEGLQQAPVGGAVEPVQRHVEHRGDPGEQLAADIALVVLDQVQVRRRDIDAAR